MIRFIFLFVALFCAVGSVVAQVSLERQVVGTAGSHSVTGDIILSSTVGESVTQTLISGSLVLTQGFQQPTENEVTSVEDLMELVVDYKVFPNPTTDLIQVRFESTELVELQLSLQDMQGRSIAGFERRVKGQGQLSTELSLASLAEGTYLLTFKNDQGEILVAHKIQKL